MANIPIPEHYILFSTTDLQGTILTASDDFVEISGYSRDELIGKPHNFVRHPMVPKAVFADMWMTLKNGKSWTATVVNRSKSGDDYWVIANVSPITEQGSVIGYISVRTPASDVEINEAKALYRQIEEGSLILKCGIARKPFDVKFDWYRNQSLFRKLMLPIAGLFVVGGLVANHSLNTLKEESLKAAGKNSASDMITSAQNSREFYMSEVIPKVKKAGMELSHDYATHPTHLPLAANVMLALGEMSKKSGEGKEAGEVRLFSAYPFKFRGDAKLDGFEKQALEALQRDPKTPFFKIEEIDGKSYFRMAVPDIMTSQTCLNCHNTDPNSVKTDWKVGDVRGAVSAKIPLTELEGVLSKSFTELSITLIVIALIALASIYGLIHLLLARLSKVRVSVDYVEQTGDMTKRVNDIYNDAIGEIVDKFNRLQNYILASLSQVSASARAISRGNFAQTSSNAKGTFVKLEESINESSKSLTFTMSELNKVMTHLEQGQFNIQMDERIPSAFRNQVDKALSSINHVMSDISDAMKKMEAGDFSARVEVEAKGQLATLKSTINGSMQSLSDAVSQISEVVDAQAHGNLTVALNDEGFKGELADLKDSINTSLTKLKAVVEVVSIASSSVNSAAEEVSHSSNSLSDRVQEQAASLAQTTTTMVQINASIQENAQNTATATLVAQDVQAKALHGEAVMSKTIEAMHGIKSSSHRIAEIVSIIDSIAFQTNLLALNAAVEAARAGEHGRGFAVVAGEVRALAGKSADAAKDIKELIAQSVERIDEGTKLADDSGDALKNIIQSVENMTSLVQQIAQATQSQKEAIHQTDMAINSIDSVTQQNAALVEETAAAAMSLTEQAQRLREEISFFKTEKQC